MVHLTFIRKEMAQIVHLTCVFLNFMFQKEKSEQKILNNISRIIQQVPDSCFNL